MAPTPVTAPSPPDAPPGPAARAERRRVLVRLAPVAAAYAAAQLLLAVPGTGLGWDETVYVSQVARDAPAAFFSAPRARGITLLVAPVTLLTPSVTALRIYLALLSAAALLLCLMVWRRLIPAPVLALAGALFACLWPTLFYGPQAMPNLWVAFGALLATGCFLRAARDPGDRLALTGLGAGTALAALMRPSDAVWLVLPLACAVPAVRAGRRPALLAALAAGALLGGTQWVVEAELRYGGLLTRLHRAGEIQGGLGWNPAFGDHLRALGGRTLCRPCDVPWSDPVTALWWFALPLLTAGGLVTAYRSGRLRLFLVPTLAALSLAAPYLLLVGYAAPRFLLPAYALLALPVALCLTRLLALARSRPLARGVLCAALAAHLALQLGVTAALGARGRDTRAAFTAVVAELHRQGVRPPCVVSGWEAVRVAFLTGCSSRQVYGDHDGSITPEGIAALARTRPAVVLGAAGAPPPPWARGWRPLPLPYFPGPRGRLAYLSPSARPVDGQAPGRLLRRDSLGGNRDGEAPVRHRRGAVHPLQVRVVMGDQDGGGGAFPGEGDQQVQDRGAALVVEGAGGLVDQQHGGLVHQRAGDVDPLALPPGELMRPLVGLVGQSHRVQQLQRPPAQGARGPAGEVGHDLELFGGGERGQQVRLLEDDADLLPAQRRLLARAERRGVLPGHDHPSRVGRDEGGGDREQAGLPRA